MSYLFIFLALALVVQGGLFFYSYTTKKKLKKDDILLKYHILTRSDLFATICRQDLPMEDIEKLNAIYVDKKEI